MCKNNRKTHLRHPFTSTTTRRVKIIIHGFQGSRVNKCFSLPREAARATTPLRCARAARLFNDRKKENCNGGAVVVPRREEFLSASLPAPSVDDRAACYVALV